MREIAVLCTAFASAFLTVWMSVRYCKMIRDGTAEPRLTTWIIFEIGVVMSLVAYCTSREHNLVENINNVADSVTVTAILVTLLIKHRQGGGIHFNNREWWALRVAMAAFVLWALIRVPWVGVAGFQFVMIVAYLPMLDRLWPERKKSPEPFGNWAMSATASAIACCTALISGNRLAVIYPLRSALFCIFVLWLIKRIEHKSKHV